MTDRKDEVREFVATMQLKLPESYLRFLEGLDKPSRIETDAGTFRLLPVNQLAKDYELNRWKGVPFVRGIRQFIRMLEYAPTDEVEFLDQGSMAAAKLSDALAIGEDIDGDGLLLVDPSDGTVFAFIADGMYLERCAASFDQLLAGPPDEAVE